MIKVYDVKGVRKDGSVYPLAIRGKNISYKGHEARVIEFRDITDQKQTEASLREAEEKFRGIFEHSHMGMVHFNKEGIITAVNEKLAEILGSSEKKLIGFDALKLIKDAEMRMAITTALSGETSHYEGNYLSVTGGVTSYVHGVISPIISNEESIIGAIGILEDISWRKQAEEDIKDSRERFQSLFNKAPTSYQSLDKDGCFIEVNQTWLDVMGYTRDEVIGINFGHFMHPDWLDFFVENFPCLKEIGKISNVELKLRKKDGTFILVSLDGRISRKLDGSFQQTHCVLHDITEQRKAEVEKADLENQLRQAYKMEAIGTMAGGIAHDFNNILAIILGNADMAKDNIPVGNPALYNLDQVLEASNRAKDLVKQILTFSRHSVQKLLLIQPCVVIRESLTLLHSTTPASVNIVQDLCKECCMIMADTTQFHQLLMNLFSNAVHAMDEKGTLGVRVEIVEFDANDIVHYSDLKAGQHLKIMVSDTGTGMDKETQEHMFDPFYTTKDVDEGTGMGLSIVLGIIKNHKGFIKVDSEPGEGSTFTIFFPTVEDVSVQKLDDITEEYPHGGERILFVDDEEMLAEMGLRMLERQGYQVTVKTNSDDALEIFRSDPKAFDLVITDQSMPNMSGSELSAELLKIRPDIPIILCTGFSKKISEEKAKGIGIKEFCTKPLDRKGLAHVVRKVLDENTMS